MCRRNALRTLIAVIVSTVAGYAQSAKFSVALYNDAGVAQPVLQKAEAVASTLFERAGVQVSWESDGRPEFGRRFSLRITPSTIPAMQASIFGVAFLSAEGEGRYADVFYSRVLQLHNDNNVSIPEVLGTVMAHELGHLLLGSNAHSETGIMQGQWRSPELDQLQKGVLLFTAEQARRMRQRINTNMNQPELAAVISPGNR